MILKNFSFSLLFIFVGSIMAFSQNNNCLLELNYGHEQHDKRLYDFNEKEYFLSAQPETWGTYNFDFSLTKNLLKCNNFRFYFGPGIAFQRSTFHRPFDNSHFENEGFLTIPSISSYDKYGLKLDAIPMILFRNKIGLSLRVRSNILFFKSINSGLYKEVSFQVNSISLSPAFNIFHKKLVFGLNIRSVHFQRVDEIIFNRIINYPEDKLNWERYNPIQVSFTIGYVW